MKSGYGYPTIQANIRDLEKTMPRHTAVYAAMNHARKCFFKAHPKGLLPSWLAFPSSRRSREFYNGDGSPIQDNPAPVISGELRRAAKLGEAFTGHRHNRVLKVRRERASGARLAIGPVTGIMYLAKRDGRTDQYLHRFAKKSRPLLTATSDGMRLELLGGAFRFTDRGIVDRPATVKRKR